MSITFSTPRSTIVSLVTAVTDTGVS